MEKKELDYILRIRNLKMYFPIKAGIILDHVIGWVKALDGVDLTIKPRQVLGLVGESGSGKTTLAKVLLLLEKPTKGEVLFQGKDIHSLDHSELKAYRRTIQAVFQDPFASLSPRLRVQEIITEPLEVSSTLSKAELGNKVVEVLHMVGLDTGLRRVYPHELSGGQRQRVAIARAISTESKTIILDEPTSALDVSVRLQIVHLFDGVQQRKLEPVLVCGADDGLHVLRKARAAVADAGEEEVVSDATVGAHPTAHIGDVGADALAEIRDLVHERDARREERVCRVLRHLRAAVVHHHDGVLGADEGLV